MQSSLWKLGALLGVIGAGFLVLLQAQKSMTGDAAPTVASTEGEFTDVEAIDALQEDGPSNDGGKVGRVALSDAYAPEPTPAADAVSTHDGPSSSSSAQLTGTSLSPAPVRTAAIDESSNPFAAFAPPTNSDPPDEQSGSSPSQESETNPFLDLVQSFAPEEDEHASEADESATPPADAFDPFGTEPAAADDPITSPSEATGSTASSLAEAQPEASGFTWGNNSEPDDQAAGEREPAAQAEPSALTALGPDDPGPMLMPPPSASEPARPPQQVEPALFETAANDDETGQASATEIVQVGAEQHTGEASDPDPHLVFPGAHTLGPSDSANAESTRPAVEPHGFSRTGQQRDLNSDAANDRATLPDGTVEMTIQPRTRAGSPDATQRPGAARGQSPTAAVNPFGDSPDSTESPAAVGSPARGNDGNARGLSPTGPPMFDIVPATARPTAEPRFPSAGRPPSAAPIQPSGAEVSAAGVERTNSLTQADFVGVGTISPDTPSTPQQAQLTIEKLAPGDAVLGQDLIYSILVRNVGRSPAKSVVIEDLVPKGSDLQGTDPQAQMTQDKRLVWQLGTMEPGALRTIRVKVKPTEAGQIGSVATVSFEAAVASRTIITAPELAVHMDGPAEVRVGEKAPVKLTLTNTGSANATNVYIRSIIAAGFEHPAAQPQNGVTDIEYEVGTLSRGQTREIELTLLAVAPGEFQNRVVLTADGNVSIEADQATKVITSRLTIQREGPAKRFVGSEAQFVNTVSNESQQLLRNVTVSELVPQGLRFVQASDGGVFDAQRRTVTWRIDVLEPGAARKLQTVVLPETAGRLPSMVKAFEPRGETAEAASELTVAGFSSLSVDVANPSRPVPVGEEIALRLKVRNRGTAAANAVETRVQLPPELRFVSASGPVRYAQQGQVIAFEPIGHIDVDGEHSFDIVLTAAEASRDARVVVQLTSSELSKPLSEDESIVIFADGQ